MRGDDRSRILEQFVSAYAELAAEEQLLFLNRLVFEINLELRSDVHSPEIAKYQSRLATASQIIHWVSNRQESLLLGTPTPSSDAHFIGMIVRTAGEDGLQHAVLEAISFLVRQTEGEVAEPTAEDDKPAESDDG